MQPPRRANGKLRVAAIMAAAAEVIAEKGYEAATMAEIADRSCTKIGSLYRFFPNKESLAETMVANARKNLDNEFRKFDVDVTALSISALADQLPVLLFKRIITPALMKLLDASEDWSVKREEFRRAVLRRLAKTLTIHSPRLPKQSAANIAQVILLNMKAAATRQGLFNSAPGVRDEFRDMNRLYLQSRLGSSKSAKNGVR